MMVHTAVGMLRHLNCFVPLLAGYHVLVLFSLRHLRPQSICISPNFFLKTTLASCRSCRAIFKSCPEQNTVHAQRHTPVRSPQLVAELYPLHGGIFSPMLSESVSLTWRSSGGCSGWDAAPRFKRVALSMFPSHRAPSLTKLPSSSGGRETGAVIK